MARVLFLLVSVQTFAQIGTKGQQQKIYGGWQNNQFGYRMTLTLRPDGTGELDGDPITFTNQQPVLTITLAGVSTIYQYSFEGKTLTVWGGDLEGKVVFDRSGGEESATTKVTQELQQPRLISDKAILGAWSANGETIQFNSDGSCIYLGNNFQYRLAQGNVTLTTSQGDATFGYSIKGNQLTLSANGKQVSYYKALGNVNSSTNSTATKSVQMES